MQFPPCFRAAGPPRGSRCHDRPPPTRVGSTSGTREVVGAARGGSSYPKVPEPGFLNAAAYALSFTLAPTGSAARVIKSLDSTIKKDTARMDDELGTLGKHARSLGVDKPRSRGRKSGHRRGRESPRRYLERECAARQSLRQAEEDRSFAKLEGERQTKVDDGQSALDKVQQELSSLEAQRRGLTRQTQGPRSTSSRACTKSNSRSVKNRPPRPPWAMLAAGLRKAVEELRKRCQRSRARKARNRTTGRRARAPHRLVPWPGSRPARPSSRQRGAASKMPARVTATAWPSSRPSRAARNTSWLRPVHEIQRRLVTLGTLVNLHRIERPEFDELVCPDRRIARRHRRPVERDRSPRRRTRSL